MKKKFFALVLIFLFSFSIPVGAYQITGYELGCEAAMLISMDTDDVLYEKNADQKMYPASIAKLMSAIVMIENIDDLENTYISYSKDANDRILGTGSVVYGLKIGEKMKAKDALAGLVISSCGDIAYAIAEHVGGNTENFVRMMNEKAAELGLTNTRYTNPVGLHDDNLYTTARDISILAKYAFANETIKSLLSKSSYVMEATEFHPTRTIVTSNLMINPNSDVYYQYAVCGKTGFTDEAGRCLVSLASYKGYTYMAVVLKSTTYNATRGAFIDSANMYRWAFKNFEYKTILDNTTPVTEAPVELSAQTDFVSLNLEGGLEALLPIDADTSTIIIKPNLSSESFDAPISKGDVLGTADIYYAEEKIGTINLVASTDIKASVVLIFARAAGNFLSSTLMKIVYVLIGLAAVVFAVITIRLNIGKKKRRKIKFVPIRKDEFKD